MKSSDKSDEISRRDFLKAVTFAASGGGVVALGLIAGCNRTTQQPTTPSSNLNTSTPASTALPQDLLYSAEHVWVQSENLNTARLGITEKLWNMITNLGKSSVKHINVINAGSKLEIDELFASIETSKMTMDLYSPVSGEVLENNTGLLTSRNVYGNAWILRVKLDHPEELEELLSYQEYVALTAQTT